ncbi:hypothetical protein IEQ34_014159 [Dendrobium chrysotoxum]|uniref:Uncharacterized protein n=1 Tax=Dendrobium chrysotoxum TaxID=161865 RepID=A0AAV7GJ50_DENCH|nr:hypothetical protein IEQ34_014159 [Dendrobium chrysotoxum]
MALIAVGRRCGGLAFGEGEMGRSLTGRTAIGRKVRKESEGKRGPESKERRRSLKTASQPRKKPEMPRKWMEVKERGRKKSGKMAGRRAKKRRRPGVVLDAAKRA